MTPVHAPGTVDPEARWIVVNEEGTPPDSTPVVIRRVRAEEWSALRALRLEALRTDPLAFGATYEGDLSLPEAEWRRRVERGATSLTDATFVAVQTADPEGFVGMLGSGFFHAEIHLWGMWVRPAFRGRGVGTRLLDALLGYLAQHCPTAALLLDVNPGQSEAVRLYLARGFRHDGRSDVLPHHPSVRILGMVRRP